MKVYLSRRYHFSSSHRLHNDAYTPEQNRATYGKCNNPYGHGHNYVVRITVSGPVDPVTGMVCNLVELDGFVRRVICERFDHKNLNLDSAFEKLVPTTENLCREIYRIVKSGFAHVMLEDVRVDETSNNSFEYSEREWHLISARQ